MLIRNAFILVAAAAAMLFGAAAVAQTGQAAAGKDPVIAKVNGVEISQAQFDRALDAFMQRLGADPAAVRSSGQYPQVQQQVIEILITQELLWQAAESAGFTVSEEEVKKARSALIERFGSEEKYQQELASRGMSEEEHLSDMQRQLSVRQYIRDDLSKGLTVTDEEVHEFYVANPSKFTRPEEVHARHILIKLDSQADLPADQKAQARIAEIREEAVGGADFAELAKKYSEGPSGPSGGDLGFFGRGRMVPPFEKAAFGLEVGEISEVVKTQFGYHIIKVEERRGGQLVPEEQMGDQIRAFLTQSKAQEAVAAKVTALRKAGDVVVMAP